MQPTGCNDNLKNIVIKKPIAYAVGFSFRLIVFREFPAALSA